VRSFESVSAQELLDASVSAYTSVLGGWVNGRVVKMDTVATLDLYRHENQPLYAASHFVDEYGKPIYVPLEDIERCREARR